jgi:hypothetical protein
VDFIKKNLRHMLEICALRPSFFSNLATSICALCSSYCIFFLIWMRSTLYAERPTFVKYTPGASGWQTIFCNIFNNFFTFQFQFVLKFGTDYRAQNYGENDSAWNLLDTA